MGKVNFLVVGEEPGQKEFKSIHKLIRKVSEDVEHFSFNTSVPAFMICVNELTDLRCNKRRILTDLIICLSPMLHIFLKNYGESSE